jgi:hypothetical protein
MYVHGVSLGNEKHPGWQCSSNAGTGNSLGGKHLYSTYTNDTSKPLFPHFLSLF